MNFRALALCLLVTALCHHAMAAPLGVNWGTIGARNPPSPAKTVQLLKSEGIGRVRFFGMEKVLMEPLRKSGIQVMAAVQNSQLVDFANNPAAAEQFINEWILGYRDVNVVAIAVGNEIHPNFFNTATGNSLVPAMRNVYKALVKARLARRIKLTSPMCCVLACCGYPPSTGHFDYTYMAAGLADYLAFLNATGSYYTANVYPYFSRAGTPEISDAFTFFQGLNGYYENGRYYQNLLDAALDAQYHALSRAGYPNMNIVITETGWPSSGSGTALTSVDNQKLYNSYIVGRTLANQGSPLRRRRFDTYLFELYDEPVKVPEPNVENHWGLFNESGMLKTNLSLKSGPVNPTSPPPQWCVAKPTASAAALAGGINYVCYDGSGPQLNCSLVEDPHSCFNTPGSSDAEKLIRKANYVYNLYYQRAWQAPGSCDFGGSARVSSVRPTACARQMGRGKPKAKRWCVAKPEAIAYVQGGIDYVCGTAGKDCSFTFPNVSPQGLTPLPGPCYSPTDPLLAASFIYNLWFQSNGQSPRACAFTHPVFGPTGMIVDKDPSQGNCLFVGTPFGGYFSKP